MTKPTSWALVLALTSAGITVAVQVGKAVAALPAVTADLRLSLTSGSWVLSAVSIAGALGGLALGAVIDRIGHRRALLAGLLLTAAGSGIGAFAENVSVLLLSRLGEGVGFTATALSVPPLLVRISAPGQRGIVLGLWSAFIPAGTGVTTLVGPWLIDAIGWRGLWLLAATLPVLVAAFLVPTTRSLSTTAPNTHPARRESIRAVLKSRGILFATVVFASYSAQFLAVFGFLPTLLTRQGALPPKTAAILTATAILVNIPGNILGGFLRGRGVPRWVLIGAASAVMAASAFAIYATGTPLALRYAGSLALSFAGGMIPSTLFAAAPELAPRPDAAAATVGALLQGSTLGQTLGPPALAALTTAFGWQSSPILLAFAATLAAGLGIALHRSIGFPRKRHDPIVNHPPECHSAPTPRSP
ncbi:CynX/NimT family MFS transporter [Sciscionella marina]|uniref:MFS transporter n=1 Tax=Sciscionella marina TaxID=508770 RepID=UPI0012F6CCD0|nr:MFS transporter [Sciscionella marina]